MDKFVRCYLCGNIVFRRFAIQDIVKARNRNMSWKKWRCLDCGPHACSEVLASGGTPLSGDALAEATKVGAVKPILKITRFMWSLLRQSNRLRRSFTYWSNAVIRWEWALIGGILASTMGSVLCSKEFREAIQRSSIMSFRQASINNVCTEGGANTISTTPAQVPNSQGAKRVWLVRCEIDMSWPDYQAAVSPEVRGAIALGKVTGTDPGLGQTHVITSKKHKYHSTGAANFGVSEEGPGQAQGRWEIFPDNDDKGFWYTPMVMGVNCTVAKTMSYRIDFEMED
jgi:hypothetical protein